MPEKARISWILNNELINLSHFSSSISNHNNYISQKQSQIKKLKILLNQSQFKNSNQTLNSWAPKNKNNGIPYTYLILFKLYLNAEKGNWEYFHTLWTLRARRLIKSVMLPSWKQSVSISRKLGGITWHYFSDGFLRF